MAKIKTRETRRGSIKTIDRASIMTEHIRQASFKVKDSSVPGTRDSDSPDSYAQDRISEYGHAAADRAVIASGSIGKSAARQIRMKKDAIEIKKRKDELLKSRNAKAAEQAAEAGLHSAKIKTPAEMQKRKAVSRKAMADKAKRDAAIRNSIKLRDRARRVRKDAKRSARAMAMAIGAAGTAAVVIVVMCVLFGAAFYFFGDDSSSYEPVSPEVEAYTPLIQKYANEYGIPQYTELIKAVMMQESGGRGKDPMQASECGYNKKYPKKPNGIKDPEYSIDCGVHYLSDNLSAAKAKSPVDMDRIKLALQGYNYGSGYLTWAVKRDGGYTVENAAAFSEQQAKKHGMDSYGDKMYVTHVLRYYPYGNYNIGVGNTAITQVASKQIGNAGGRKFWSWYGFNGRVEWCCCFVSWCGDQCGYIKAGVMPKFAGVANGVSWFKSKGQWQKRTYTPAPGDIIFFDWGGNGTGDHVGIVEKVDNGYVCTIEGNSGDAVRRQKYRIGYYEILGYGIPKY